MLLINSRKRGLSSTINTVMHGPLDMLPLTAEMEHGGFYWFFTRRFANSSR
jgi:hypothetical protein